MTPSFYNSKKNYKTNQTAFTTIMLLNQTSQTIALYSMLN